MNQAPSAPSNGSTVHQPTATIKSKGKTVFSRSRLWFFLFAVLLFGAAVYYSATIEKDIKLFEKVKRYWLAAALLGQLLTYGFAALVYRTLVQLLAHQRTLSLGELFQATIVSQFLNQAIPSAGVSGNTYVLRLLGRRHVPPAQALALIVLELLTFYIAIEGMIILALILGSTLYSLPAYFFVLLAAGFGVYFLFGVGVGLFGRKKAMEWLHRKLSRLGLLKKALGKLEVSFRGAATAAPLHHTGRYMQEHRGPLAAATGWQACIYAADVLTLYALFRGLGAPLPLVAVFIGLILTRIITVLPVSPGALILYESSMTFFYTSMGAPLSVAVVVTLLYRLLSFWLPMPAGFLIYRRLQKDSPRKKASPPGS